jgi:translation elongation factor EF-G
VRLADGLQQLIAEDATIRVTTDQATGEVVIAGTSELHLGVILDRLKREFTVEAGVGRPRVAYKETLTRGVDGEMKSVRLEPLMRVEVVVPEEYMGDVIANLSSRRGQMQSQTVREGMLVATACVPLAEMFGYSFYLRERTRGRGTCTMRFDRYEPFRPVDDTDGSRDSLVGAPRKPRPRPRSSRLAMPEPEQDGLQEE